MALTAESINERSRKLMEEFIEHWAEVKAAHPEVTDKLVVFMLWQNQKIAGLQEICLSLATSIQRLTDFWLNGRSDHGHDGSLAGALSQEAGTVRLDWVASLAGEEGVKNGPAGPAPRHTALDVERETQGRNR